MLGTNAESPEKRSPPTIIPAVCRLDENLVVVVTCSAGVHHRWPGERGHRSQSPIRKGSEQEVTLALEHKSILIIFVENP